MRKIVEYFRSVFCKHDYRLIAEGDVYERDPYRLQLNKYPSYHKWVYICNKCKYVKTVTDEK